MKMESEGGPIRISLHPRVDKEEMVCLTVDYGENATKEMEELEKIGMETIIPGTQKVVSDEDDASAAPPNQHGERGRRGRRRGRERGRRRRR